MATAIIIGAPGESRIILTAPQALALLALLRDPEEVRQIVAYISAECECEQREPQVTIDPTVEPTASPGSTPVNAEPQGVLRPLPADRPVAKNPPRRRNPRKSKTVVSLAESIPTETIVPSAPIGTPLPTPGPLPAAPVEPIPTASVEPTKPARKPRATKPTKPVTIAPAAPTMIQDFVVRLPDGRETYVAVYSDGSVIHETSTPAAIAA